MPEQLKMSIDEIAAKRAHSFHDGVFYRAAKMPRSFNKDTRSATFIMTDETKDSYGDIVRAKGCDLTRFESNPIALLNHNSNMILGTWSDVNRVSKRIEGTVTLADEGTAPHVDMAYKLMSQGILRAASVGFMLKDYDLILDEDGRFEGLDMKAWEMTECSVVSVPANPSALAKAIKDGDKLALEFIEKVLDTYTRTGAGLIVAKADLEAIRTEGLCRGATVTVEENLDVDGDEGEQRSLEIDDADDTTIVLDLDTSAVETKISGMAKMVDALLTKMRALAGIVAEPEPVEGGLERAKALQARMKKNLPD